MVQYELVLRSVYYEYIRCTMRLVVLAGRGYAWRPQLIDPVSCLARSTHSCTRTAVCLTRSSHAHHSTPAGAVQS
jgi:hypothetical protein